MVKKKHPKESVLYAVFPADCMDEGALFVGLKDLTKHLAEHHFDTVVDVYEIKRPVKIAFGRTVKIF